MLGEVFASHTFLVLDRSKIKLQRGSWKIAKYYQNGIRNEPSKFLYLLFTGHLKLKQRKNFPSQALFHSSYRHFGTAAHFSPSTFWTAAEDCGHFALDMYLASSQTLGCSHSTLVILSFALDTLGCGHFALHIFGFVILGSTFWVAMTVISLSLSLAPPSPCLAAPH